MATSHAVFGVIPTLFVAGPLAIFAVLFPGLAAAVLLLFRRWSSAFLVLSLNSSLLFLHSWFQSSLRGHWWGSFMFLWILLGVISFFGTARSLRRARKWSTPLIPQEGSRGEWIMICMLSLVAFSGVGYCIIREKSLLDPQQRALLVLSVGTWTSFAYMSLAPSRPTKALWVRRLSPEIMMLGAIGLASISVTLFTYIGEFLSDEKVALAWSFEPDEDGAIYSSPAVLGDCVFTAVAHQRGAAQFGAVYCLDRHSGNVLWMFNDGGAMKPVFSSPCVWDGRLYIGEGFHGDSKCRLYCIDAKKGCKLWEFVTQGHTESSPSVVDGNLYFGAGDDGMYCADAVTGVERWHFAGPHVDGRPAVAGGRVYAGSGYGKYEVFCLDAHTGWAIWRRAVELPSFGSPTPAGERVYFGIGNGNFLSSAVRPAGALLCLNAINGEYVWRFDVPDAVHAKPVISEGHIYFNCRDNHCYCLDSEYGQSIWRHELGSAAVAEPILAADCHDGQPRRLYTVATEGNMYCLDLADGSVRWRRDLRESHQEIDRFISSPSVVVDQAEHGCHGKIYYGASIYGRPVLYCLDERLDK